MKRGYLAAGSMAALILAGGGIVAARWAEQERFEQQHYDRDETLVTITPPAAGARARLFRAGGRLSEASAETSSLPRWLSKGRYFVTAGDHLYWPVPLMSYRGGPDHDGSFAITVRAVPQQPPPVLLPGSPAFKPVPSGHFVIGDSANPREPHYFWLTTYYVAESEVTNAEFRLFLDDPNGWPGDRHWTEAGARWKHSNRSESSARLNPNDSGYPRFGQPDQPVTGVTWFEAAAFCRWMTDRTGQGRWVYSLPTDAEWEKAARGPDGFDYGLGMRISDAETKLYNWKKNPDAPVPVIGFAATKASFSPNRYGLYHMSGNVAEWTMSAFRPFGREKPYSEVERNRQDLSEQRTARGGSWYSASIAFLYLAYRDAFEPSHRIHDLGFRVVAKIRP